MEVIRLMTVRRNRLKYVMVYPVSGLETHPWLISESFAWVTTSLLLVAATMVRNTPIPYFLACWIRVYPSFNSNIHNVQLYTKHWNIYAVTSPWECHSVTHSQSSPPTHAQTFLFISLHLKGFLYVVSDTRPVRQTREQVRCSEFLRQHFQRPCHMDGILIFLTALLPTTHTINMRWSSSFTP